MRADVESFFVTGGTLRHDAPSYVERKADRDLFESLLRGEFCYVLTSRQMGKSSLMVRTASKLRARGVDVVVLDLTAVGQNLTPEQWYDGLLVRMGRDLRLENELDEFWSSKTRLSPVQRFISALQDVVLAKGSAPLVVFVDETDIVRSLPFSTDEFFAAIRECYNSRTRDSVFERLTFCLMGVATPSDLIRDTRLTPFNIGRRIELNDFTAAEAIPLAKGLATSELGNQDAELILNRVLHWTNGHPYLTQRFCRAIADHGGVNKTKEVDLICLGLFLSLQARDQDDNLIFVRERLLDSEVDRAALLDLYGKVRKGKPVVDTEADPTASALKLSGIASGEMGRLRVRNRIYHQVFDRAWIVANLPQAERIRQRAAFRRGAVGASIGLALLITVTSLPLFTESGRPGVTTPGLTNVVVTTPRAQADRVVLRSFEGEVEFMRFGSGSWDRVYTNIVLHPGDRLRTGYKSRALLQWNDNSIVQINAQSELALHGQRKQSLIDFLRGLLFFKGSKTNTVIETPAVKATIRG